MVSWLAAPAPSRRNLFQSPCTCIGSTYYWHGRWRINYNGRSSSFSERVGIQTFWTCLFILRRSVSAFSFELYDEFCFQLYGAQPLQPAWDPQSPRGSEIWQKFSKRLRNCFRRFSVRGVSRRAEYHARSAVIWKRRLKFSLRTGQRADMQRVYVERECMLVCNIYMVFSCV